jgi:hypothetical protein
LYPAVNPALKLECCSVRCPQRIRSFHEGTPLRTADFTARRLFRVAYCSVRCPQRRRSRTRPPLRTADPTAKRLRWGQRTLHSKGRQERMNLANVHK